MAGSARRGCSHTVRHSWPSLAVSPEDMLRIVREEFARWFDEETAGPASRYAPVAEELWRLARPEQTSP